MKILSVVLIICGAFSLHHASDLLVNVYAHYVSDIDQIVVELKVPDSKNISDFFYNKMQAVGSTAESLIYLGVCQILLGTIILFYIFIKSWKNKTLKS